MRRTKKVGSTGWMGPRYGIRIRRRVLEIDRAQHKASTCPKCSTVTLWRVASGIYECQRCGVRVSSGAYVYVPPPPITRQERGSVENPPAKPAGKR
ncbi:MAG: 50S ribosomal protein L37ae [Thermoplasmata archaeon]|nr:50S ribosomal protein L37ae [Thermoplasmata archaeon]